MKLKNRIPLLPLSIIALIVLLVLTYSTGWASVSSDSIVYFPVTIDNSDQLFRDVFEDPQSGWPVDLDKAVRWSYQNDEYDMLIFEEKRWAGAWAPFEGLTVNSAYSVEADVRRIDGDLSRLGIIFDLKDWDNLYYVIMDPGSQWFGVAKIVNGDRELVVPRTNTSAIKPGNAINHLKVDRIGDEITVIINGHAFPPVYNSGFGVNPGVGLCMETRDEAPANTRFDNFEVWRLGNDVVQSVQMKQSEEISVRGIGSYSVLTGKDAELFE